MSDAQPKSSFFDPAKGGQSIWAGFRCPSRPLATTQVGPSLCWSAKTATERRGHGFESAWVGRSLYSANESLTVAGGIITI